MQWSVKHTRHIAQTCEKQNKSAMVRFRAEMQKGAGTRQD